MCTHKQKHNHNFDTEMSRVSQPASPGVLSGSADSEESIRRRKIMIVKPSLTVVPPWRHRVIREKILLVCTEAAANVTKIRAILVRVKGRALSRE